jgi:hypothetical protein
LDIVMTSINAGGATGLSQMASYGNAALADCSSCDCVDTCSDRWGIAQFEGFDVGAIIDRGDDYVTVQTQDAYGFGGAKFALIKTGADDACCVYAAYEILSGASAVIIQGTFCDEPRWPATGWHGVSLGDSVNSLVIYSDVPSQVKITFS